MIVYRSVRLLSILLGCVKSLGAAGSSARYSVELVPLLRAVRLI